MHMHIVSAMTKAISLSEKAYETLKNMKKKGESFSDVVLRVADEKRKKSIFEFAGTWKGSDLEKVFSIVLKDREQSKSREIEYS
jgi:predicted CopG family antitoxin